METKQQRSRRAASNSFTEPEVEAFLAFVRTFRRGADARMIARSEAMVNLERKFLRMKESIAKAKGGDDGST